MSIKNVALAAILICLSVGSARAGLMTGIHIEVSGMNITYNGSAIYDSHDVAGGNHDVDEATPVTLKFWKNGDLVETLNTDVYADLLIPNVVDLPDNGDRITTINSTSPNGVFGLDLLQNVGGATSCLLDLNFSSLKAYYLSDDLPSMVFVGGKIKMLESQSLPGGLILSEADPITISLVVSGIYDAVTDRGYVKSFTGMGAVMVDGKSFVPVPEPVSGVLLALFGSLCGVIAILKSVVR
jgi:hypothetical protein